MMIWLAVTANIPRITEWEGKEECENGILLLFREGSVGRQIGGNLYARAADDLFVQGKNIYKQNLISQVLTK